jgi:glycosyltransferase involved in cell wall biosynthesis
VNVMSRNVLQFIPSFEMGGSERQGLQITRLLLESGRFNVHLACIHRRGPLLDEARRLGFAEPPSFPLTSFHDWNTLRQLRRLVSYLREHDIRVLQTYDLYTNIFGMLAATLARTPVRIAARRETKGTRSRLQEWAERRSFALADVVAANSQAVKQELIDNGVSPAKVVVVYNGIDTERIRPQLNGSRGDLAASFNLPTNRRFVTIVANMRHTMKDQPTFLRAAKRVREAFSDAAFVLAGEGELVNVMRDHARELGIAGDTFFVGRCDRVSELLAISDVCVLSSKGVEGFSNSIAEYMAAARPVVATDVGGAREAIVDGETGWIVPPRDDKALAERMVELLRDPERARAMGERGRLVVTEKFSCAAQLARIEELYA